MAGSSPDKDFEVEAPVAEEKEPYAPEGPELQQWLVNEYLEEGSHAWIW